MRKILGLAMMATLLMSASAFAVDRHLTIAPNATFAAGAPSTTNNSDSCDIGVTPAATLLLPYFEVETTVRSANTLFTVTNTSRFPQIAHVVLWTDWSFPVLDFNIFLTGYDVQPISLYDVIVSGIVAPPSGTSATTAIGTATPPAAGSAPALNNSNPNFAAGFAGNCSSLPGSLPASLVAAVQQVLTTGSSSFYCSDPVGGSHGTRAVGYITVDVVSACNQLFPTDPGYVGGPQGILYDNTLIGDYQQIGPSPSGSAGTGFDAGGNPMVHIRAIPEGGAATSVAATNLPFTFYNRFSPTNADRRQPLPSVWAARYVQGGSAGLTTNYKIWREGITGAGEVCTNYVTNSSLQVTSIIRFDEHENSTSFGTSIICSPCIAGVPTLPETSQTATTASIFPPLNSADVSGWMYLNLSNAGTSATPGPTFAGNVLTASRAGFGSPRTTSQNWVIVSLFGNIASSRLSVDFDAAWLGNGCTPAPAAGAVIGPQPFGSQTGALICNPTMVTGCAVGTVVPLPNP
jgi:hypothetical protein